MITKVISGCQEGADRAGLDAALALGIKTGGWIPRDRRRDGGTISFEDIQKYGLAIHPGNGYPPRTEQNIVDSDGTILFGNMQSPGCRLTIKCCKNHSKPSLSLTMWDLLSNRAASIMLIRQFILTNDLKVLNIAGNRASTNPPIYQLTYDILMEALKP